MKYNKYNYNLVRSDRRTISIIISADNSITIRSPLNTSEQRIEKFLQSKSVWLDKKIAENNRIIADNYSVKSYKTVLVSGKNIPLVIGKVNRCLNNGIYVKNLSGLQKLLRDNYGRAFLDRFNNTASLYGFYVNSVKFRSYKARWGCCDNGRNIVFNYKILMLPTDLQDYIIVHELCHTKFMNHSSEFWTEVKSCCDGYLYKRKRLKEYAFLTRLYP